MGTVREVKGVKGTRFYARVRMDGVNDCESFETRKAANDWIKLREAEILRGKNMLSVNEIRKTRIGAILDEVIESGMLNKFQESCCHALKDSFHSVTLKRLNTELLRKWLEAMKDYRPARGRLVRKNGKPIKKNGELLRQVCSPATIRKYYYQLKSALQWHAKKHNYDFNGKPFDENSPPPAWSNPRDRILETVVIESEGKTVQVDELELLLRACDKSRKNRQELKDFLLFQFHGATRSGEALQIKWRDIHFDKEKPYKSYIQVRKEYQKTRAHRSTTDRYIPMSHGMYELFKTRIMPRKGLPDERVFPYWKDSNQVAKRFKVIRNNAGLSDLVLHDFRHTATTKIFEESNLTDLQIASITGHTDLRTLNRYMKKRPEEIGKKLWRIQD